MKNQELYQIMADHMEKNKNMLATVIEGENTGKRLFFTEGRLVAESGEDRLSPELISRLAETEQSSIIEADGCRIILAKHTGFHVTVLEDRPFFADQARVAGADQVICDDFASALEKIPGGSDTYFLVVTRGHRYDGICLTAILKKERAYVGMMASRKRGILLKKKLVEEGFPESEVERLHTPVGLSIHAETPEEIAVSIVAELIMVKNSIKKTGGYDKELLACLTGESYPEQKKALATIVARQGSAPREIGTKMAVLSDGRIVGTIGGGCMESRIRNQCLHMLKEENPQSRLVLEDMSGQEAEEEGLVCGGRIRVFLEVL